MILDVGAGWGKYGLLLRPDYIVDACEIWEPYVEPNYLKLIYRNVYVSDICDLTFDHYDAIIFGDVFEHIERAKAQAMLDIVRAKCTEVYVVVPYLYPQGPFDGNPYEEHLQDDLTPEIMMTSYPMLRLHSEGEGKGLYLLA